MVVLISEGLRTLVSRTRRWQTLAALTICIFAANDAAAGPYTRSPNTLSDDSSRLRGEELREAVSDIEMRTAPPSWRIAPFLGVQIPFQPVGVGAQLDLHPAAWLDIPPFWGCIAEYVAGLPCAQTGFTIGYVPMPGFLTFELRTAFPIY